MECIDNEQLTALHCAASNGHVSCLERLIVAGTLLESTNNHGRTALHQAAIDGHLSCIEALIGAKANLESLDSYRWTCLLYAAFKGHIDCLKKLIAAGSNIHAVNRFGNTALHYAASRGHHNCVAALISARSDLEVCNISGFTPLHLAAENGHADCVKALLGSGANKDVRGGSINFTPLHYAARGDYIDSLQALLAAEADKETRANRGYTPLHIAAESGAVGCLKALVAAGADRESRDSLSSSTPLHVAASMGRAGSVQALIQSGANIHSTASWERTALHIAAANGYIDCLKLLIKAGANVQTLAIGGTPLRFALVGGHLECMSVLIASGIKWHSAYLEYALRCNRLDVIRHLTCEIYRIISAPLETVTLSRRRFKALILSLRFAGSQTEPKQRHSVGSMLPAACGPMLTSIFQSEILQEELCSILLDEIRHNGDPSKYNIFNEDTRRMLATFLIAQVSSYVTDYFKESNNYRLGLEQEVQELLSSESIIEEVLDVLNKKIAELKKAHKEYRNAVRDHINKIIDLLHTTHHVTRPHLQQIVNSLFQRYSILDKVLALFGYPTIQFTESVTHEVYLLRNIMRTSKLKINSEILVSDCILASLAGRGLISK